MAVKFLLERCFQIPPGHLVCGNSLPAKQSVNLKKKNQNFPEFLTTAHYPGPISHCSLLFKLPVNFFKVYLCKGKISFNLFYYFNSGLLETVQTTKMSPVVISRGGLCVRFNYQQSRSLVGVRSSGSGKEAFAAFFVAVICKWVWLRAAAGAAAAALPSTPIPGGGHEAQTLDRVWSEAGVGDCPLSETFSLAFGFSMRKWLVRAEERGALLISPVSDIFTFQTSPSSFHLSWFWHV